MKSRDAFLILLPSPLPPVGKEMLILAYSLEIHSSELGVPIMPSGMVKQAQRNHHYDQPGSREKEKLC